MPGSLLDGPGWVGWLPWGMARISPDELAQRVTDLGWQLRTISDRAATMPISDGEWTPKHLVGHLIDSATNNHQRLVRAQITEHLTDGVLHLDRYAQEQWVLANGWADRPWTDLISFWEAVNNQLVWLLRRFPEHAWQVPISLSGGEPQPLEESLDYIEHLDEHAADLRRATLSLMPNTISCANGVCLRLPTPDDVDWLVESCQDPAIPLWTGIVSPYYQQSAKDFVERARQWIVDRALPRNYLIEDQHGKPVGMCGLVRVDADDLVGEVGYWLARPERGKGYATIAVRGLTNAVLRAGYRCVTAEVIAGNSDSQRVLERAGFTDEGVLRSIGLQGSPPNVRRIDAHHYSLLPTDLAAAQLAE